MRASTETDRLAAAAAVSAAAMIAFQVGGKATRDALFLGSFPVTELPRMLILSAAVSIAAVFTSSFLVSRRGPGVVFPLAFGASSLLLLAQWALLAVYPRLISVTLYVHIAAFGAILISGFWSMVAELFDPRTAKSRIGRIAAGGTLGGLIGGVIAERTGALLSVNSMLPILAGLHLICALVNHRLRRPENPSVVHAATAPGGSTHRSAFQVLRDVPYLRMLAILVLTSTVAETMLDYVLKAEATAASTRMGSLIRFFAIFYTGISLVTFLVQAAFSRYSLQHLGLAGSISSMPFTVAAGGLLTLVWPGLLTTALVRGLQSILRSSLFRSGYELLYTPVSREEKRGTKVLVDVGFDRLGDAIGGGLIQVVLAAGLVASTNSRTLTAIAVALAIFALVLISRISKGYVSTLEKSLLNQAAELDLLDMDERTTRSTMLRTLGTLDLAALRQLQSGVEAQIPLKSSVSHSGESESESPVKRITDLHSENADVVRAALKSQEVLDLIHVAPVIRLLARDEVSEDAVKALRPSAAAIIGQLTDALLNLDQDFAVRRRIPRILATCTSDRAVDGLMRGLADIRFEVRFSCGRALARICEVDSKLRPQAEGVYVVTRQEIALAQRLSEAPRVLDSYEEDSASAVEPWSTTDLRLEHIFRLLSLCLPREPLRVAFQALHADNAYLKGTALEYLETILPLDIREGLWKFFVESRAATRPSSAMQK
jgi:hypothetical protein